MHTGMGEKIKLPVHLPRRPLSSSSKIYDNFYHDKAWQNISLGRRSEKRCPARANRIRRGAPRRCRRCSQRSSSACSCPSPPDSEPERKARESVGRLPWRTGVLPSLAGSSSCTWSTLLFLASKWFTRLSVDGWSQCKILIPCGETRSLPTQNKLNAE